MCKYEFSTSMLSEASIMGAGWPHAPNVLSGGAQLLNGPTQYLTLNSVLMNLEYNLYHISCYSAYAVVTIVVVIYSCRNQQ